MQNSTVFQKSTWKSILSLSIPALLSIVVMMLYNMADMYFIGWLGDVSQVASVALASPVFSILMAISTMIGNGGCTRIAQALGAQDINKGYIYTSICVWSSILFGIIFAAACFLLCNPLLRFLGANQEMWESTRAYILVLALGAPFILLNHSLNGALRGEGAIKIGLFCGTLSTLANIILDPIFIIILKMGVGGAALATVLSNVIADVCYLIFCIKGTENCFLELHPKYARDLKALGSIMALGLPNAISSILSGFAGTFSNRLLVGYGTNAVAAMAAASKVVMIVTMIQMGIYMGVQPLLAYCYGARDWTRLKDIIKKLLSLSFGLGTVLTTAIWLKKGALIGLFIKDASVATLGQRLASYTILTCPLIGIYYFSTTFLQTIGNAASASLASALRQGILLIPFLYLMNSLFQMPGLVMAHLTADSISILITGSMAVYSYFRIISPESTLHA